MLTQTVAGRTYDYDYNVGARNMGMAIGVAFGTGDAMYILSRQHEQLADVPWNKTAVQAKVGKYTIPDTPGGEELLFEFGQYGDSDGELIWPTGIAADSHENIYVSDEWLNRVSIYDSDGVLQSAWGKAGSGDGEFQGAAGIAFDPDENLYVVDSLNHRVQKFTKDGEYLGQFGGYGSDEGRFNSPWGIEVDKDGSVYVADHKNHRIQKFDSDGKHVMTFGSFGTDKGQLNRPSDVSVDPEGDVYVCDWANSRVQIFDKTGRFVTSLIGDAQDMAKWHKQQVDSNADVLKARRRVESVEPEWRFALPVGVDYDPSRNRIVVSDSQRWRIQMYRKVSDYVEPQRNL
jgi:DNA-binding beta-propeller fold protein YncE